MNTNTQALREALERIKSNLMHTRRFGVDDLGTWRRAATQAEGDIEELLESHPPAPEHSGERPAPMTREFCAAFPGTVAGIINELAQQIDAATTTAEPAVEAVPKGWKLVPVEPSSDMLDRAVAFALMSVLTGDYKWSQYMTDLWGRFLSAVPAAPEAAKPDNWQQYAQDGENAQQCIERHRKEQDALLTLLANARRPYSDNEEMKL